LLVRLLAILVSWEHVRCLVLGLHVNGRLMVRYMLAWLVLAWINDVRLGRIGEV